MFKQRKSKMSFLNGMLVDLPAPINLSNMWNFGSSLSVFFSIQIVTGVFLAMHYSSDIEVAFNCINHIMREVNLGWMLRFMHANGASFFFMLIYLHVGRGLYYNSFMLKFTWLLGVFMFFLSMGLAFLGYVLPWGQMSFWGATVITNLISAIPYVGTMLVEWLWGGFSVNNSTLTRFFALHYLLPFILMGLLILHLSSLHNEKSSNPLGILSPVDKMPFNPFYQFKDLNFLIIILSLFMLLIFSNPYLLMDAENFIPANPMVTPPHIQPEWYFLFAYAILRSVPNKLGGVLALIISIAILIPLIFKTKQIQMMSLNQKKYMFWGLIISFMILTWLGMKPVESPFIFMGQIFTILYFLIMIYWIVI